MERSLFSFQLRFSSSVQLGKQLVWRCAANMIAGLERAFKSQTRIDVFVNERIELFELFQREFVKLTILFRSQANGTADGFVSISEGKAFSGRDSRQSQLQWQSLPVKPLSFFFSYLDSRDHFSKSSEGVFDGIDSVKRVVLYLLVCLLLWRLVVVLSSALRGPSNGRQHGRLCLWQLQERPDSSSAA